MQFADVSEYKKSVSFFMLRQTSAYSIFIITLLSIITIAFFWMESAQMDDVVKATALLRPIGAISLIRAGTSGELLQKGYEHNDYINAGTLLLRIDVTSDIIELDNSQKLMVRIVDNITNYNTLLETIRTNQNVASGGANDDAYLWSEAYLLEYQILLNGIEALKLELSREANKPKEIIIRSSIEDIENKIANEELNVSLWKTNQMTEAINTVKNLLQNKENLERRIADLTANIKNATLYAPIAGRVSEIRRLNTGDRVIAGEEIINIIPENDNELKAEIYVDPAYVALVKTGQNVTLRFPGLPPSSFGKLDTTVTLIPADYTVVEDGQAVFVVEAYIPHPWLDNRRGSRQLLRPGISAEARIVIDQDTILHMVLKKLDFIDTN